jgi:hypothetical protein
MMKLQPDAKLRMIPGNSNFLVKQDEQQNIGWRLCDFYDGSEQICRSVSFALAN